MAMSRALARMPETDPHPLRRFAFSDEPGNICWRKRE
jgi:hypothetical protein